MAHLPEDILVEILPFIDYVNNKYNNILHLVNPQHAYENFESKTWSNSGGIIYILESIQNIKINKYFSHIYNDFTYFNDSNKLVNFKLTIQDDEIQIVPEYKKNSSWASVAQTRVLIPRITKNILCNILSHQFGYPAPPNGDNILGSHNILTKTLIYDNDYFLKLTNGKEYFKVKFVEQLVLPKYNKYIAPMSIEEKSCRITFELQKYLINDLVLIVFSYIDLIL